MIDIIDYGGGNLGSITRCLDRFGIDHRRVKTGNALLDSDHSMILPGVGAFGYVVKNLRKRGLAEALITALSTDRALLGICVGMQVLFESSEESPGVPGLCVLKGEVVRFTTGKTPQVGWNELAPRSSSNWPEGHVYFVNSYFTKPVNDSIVLYESDYFGSFCAAVRTSKITAFQFHPEKSGVFGQILIRRWLDAL